MATVSDYISSSYYDSSSSSYSYSSSSSTSNSFLSGLGISTDSSSFSLSDYAAIRNGSYKKLLKAYYSQQDSSSSTADSTTTLTSIQTSANAAAQSIQKLMDESLWEKKTTTTTDEETGETTTTTDYDWDAITKALNSFIEDYNDMLDASAESNTLSVLRNAAWLTSITSSNANLLAKVGITIGSDNKLELDEDTLKSANITDLTSLFTGSNSYASKVYQKANTISSAAASAGGSYTSSGTYSSTLTSTSTTVDTEA